MKVSKNYRIDEYTLSLIKAIRDKLTVCPDGSLIHLYNSDSEVIAECVQFYYKTFINDSGTAASTK